MASKAANEQRKPSQHGPKSMPRRAHSRPACTHTKMVRVYGKVFCHMCQRRPLFGFVYRCHQDVLQHLSASDTNSSRRRKLLKPYRETSTGVQSISKHLESLGLSKSVAQAAENGHYTPEQIQILKEQKRNVKKTIRQSIDQWEILKSRFGPSATVLNEMLCSISGRQTTDSGDLPHRFVRSDQDQRDPTTSLSEGTASSETSSDPAPSSASAKASISKAFQPCVFSVCHACRPFFRDRCYISFESAWEEAPVEKWIPELMPVTSAFVMRYIGLPKSPMDFSASDSLLFDSADESLSEGEVRHAKRVRLTSKPSSLGFHECLVRDFESLTFAESSARSFDGLQQDSLAEPGASESHEHAMSFDLDLWKSLNDELLDCAAQVPLPDEDMRDEFDIAAERSGEPEISLPSLDSITEEPATEPNIVERGVALTEEAFENNSPDIITTL